VKHAASVHPEPGSNSPLYLKLRFAKLQARCSGLSIKLSLNKLSLFCVFCRSRFQLFPVSFNKIFTVCFFDSFIDEVLYAFKLFFCLGSALLGRFRSPQRFTNLSISINTVNLFLELFFAVTYNPLYAYSLALQMTSPT
ncbi:MAG: hypothetical protein ACO3NK_18185, partial [Prochlorotrichaceae cyanobacterium]